MCCRGEHTHTHTCYDVYTRTSTRARTHAHRSVYYMICFFRYFFATPCVCIGYYLVFSLRFIDAAGREKTAPVERLQLHTNAEEPGGEKIQHDTSRIIYTYCFPAIILFFFLFTSPTPQLLFPRSHVYTTPQ